MKTCIKWLPQWFLFLACLGGVAHAEDIDIFAGTTTVNTNLPNVIFVLDNTSNWSRQSQQWPGGLTQGQSEARAIKTALEAQVGKLNVGLLEYSTQGSSGDTDGGYVRFDLQELTDTSKAEFDGIMDTIFNDINGNTEKRSSSNLYGYLPSDFYNYLSGGAQSKSGAGTPSSLADLDAYADKTNFTSFRSPLGAADACADTYLIFLGNNANGNIASDDATNTAALKALYRAAGETAPDALAGDGGTPLAMPEFTSREVEAEAIWVEPVYGPDEVVTGYWEETTETQTVPVDGYTIDAEDVGPSRSCWKTTEAAACSVDENSSGGLCVGRTDCICTAVADPSNDPPGCTTTGKKADRTYRWDVVVPEQVVAPTTEEVEVVTGREWVEYDEPVLVPGEIVEAGYWIPAGTIEIFEASGGSDTTNGLSYNFDDWTKFLHNYGIPLTVTVGDDTFTQRVKVTTYTIDVFNRQQNGDLSGLWFSAANAGGGRYFQAKSEEAILAALNTALGDILSVSSSFAAVSLPLSSTNRARVDNQVYIGMFRPAAGKKPRWFGNLKRYQLAMFGGIPKLADVKLHSAINPLTGFATECSESFWSTDSSTYWENLGVSPAPLGECNDIDVTTSGWSDLPDGPFVEKGGVAQQSRGQGSRTLYTVGDAGLRALADGDATGLGSTSVLEYVEGTTAGSDGEVMPASGLRASIHGDVVHSRPLSLRYSPTNVRLYYGTNDGLFRAVNAADGTEEWSMLAPEHYGKVQRLYDNTPLIKYTGATDDAGFEYAQKDYFFDGATGQFVIYNDTGGLDLAYIFPTMRRGGRMVYGIDVTDPDAAPSLLWRLGCPNLDNDDDCSIGFDNIGQTWSMPIGAYAASYVDGDDNAKPLVMFGGGFDDCLDEDVAAYPSACDSANGKGVYIVDAATGILVRHLATDAPVVSEVSPIDIDFDGHIDFAYAADVAGNLYRISFTSLTDSNPLAVGAITALEQDEWAIDKIGASSDNERRFYNAPTAAAFRGVVIVTNGSGDRERPLESNYPFRDNVQNRFYALIDQPYVDGEVTPVNLDGDTMYAVVDPDTLEEVAEEVEENRGLRDYDGWYMDLPDRGEQVANPAAIAGGKVFFNTFQPGGASTGLCTRPLGIGTGYALNLFRPEYTEGTGIPGGGIPIPPIIATVKIPPGLPACDGVGCPEPPVDPCADGACEVVTVCIGCEGFEPVLVEPVAPPIRRRMFWTEDIDRRR